MAQTLSRFDWHGALLHLRRRCADATCYIDAETGEVETARRNVLLRLLWRLLGLKRRAMVVAPTRDFLVKRLEVPKRARTSLESIVHLAIEKSTPFQPADVYWSVQGVGHDDADGRVTADLVLLTRNRMADCLAVLRGQALLPLAVVSADGAYTIRLGHQGRSWRWPALAAVTLVVAAAAVPLIMQERVIARLEAKVATLDQPPQQAPRLVDDGREAAWATHLAERTHLGVPVALLAELTGRLPDDTYIEFYRQHDGLVEIRGRTPRATSLAERLARSTAFENVRLGAPTSHGDGERQQFVLIADVAQVSR